MFITILLSIFLFGCPDDYPKMPWAPKIYHGVSEIPAICRYTGNEDVPDEMECIPTDEVEFNKYKALLNKDHAMIQSYIITLIDSCERWKTD